MAFETIDHRPVRPRGPRRRRRSPLEVTLIAGFVFSLAIGFIALGVLFWMRTPVQAVDANAKPALALQPAQISPGLALMELTGDPAAALARQALAAGHADTAFAIAVYGVDLAPPVRRALLQQVAHAYAAGNRNAESAIALHGARVLTLLAPELTATDRHQALLAIADTYLAIDAPAQAVDTLQQVLRAAVQTPGLLPAQRVEVFDAVRPLAQAAAADVLAAQAGEYARNPFLNPTGQLPTNQLADLMLPAPQPPAVQQSAVQQALVQAVEQRRFAARILAERIQLTGGIDIEPEQQTLAIALQAEDTARANVYRNAQATVSLTPGEQLWFLMERRTWLAQKARIAKGGFGLTLVPEWEVNADFILQDLSTVHTNINVLVNAMSNDIADPVAQSALRLEVLKLLAQAWEFGLHPDGLAGDLGERMRIVQDELASLNQRPALPVGYTDTVAPPGFRIQEE